MYNYNGESMKKEDSLISNIVNNEDINKIKKTTKYINLSLNHINNINKKFFIEHGQKYYYAEILEDIIGYIYVDYETFSNGEEKLSKIIETIPNGLNDIEKIRYIYIKLGQMLSYDINLIREKNELFSYNSLGIINNVWGSLSLGKITNISVVKILKYICNILNINCSIVKDNSSQFLCNKIIINDQVLILNLTLDIPYIQGKFSTKGFSLYNDDIEMDKKIGYIDDNYSEKIIDTRLKENIRSLTFENILTIIQEVIPITNISPIELGIILNEIFFKYYPDVDFNINNLYINDIYGNKEHFILLSCDNKYYSYNYKKESFVKISKEEIIHNLNTKKIGIYLDETIPNLDNYSTKYVC